MDVPFWVWAATVAGLLALLALDLLVVGRKPREVSIKESGAWVAGYALLAVLFGLGLLVLEGGRYAGEFYAGYLTEYSLSIDNLFVFVILMGAFAVPRQNQHKVLLVGIVLALIFRGLFIALGAVVIARFQWVFFLFGAFLLYTAWKLATHREQTGEYRENVVIRWTRRVLPVTDAYHGTALTVRVRGRRLVTPMLVVMIAIGTTDILFALDSIPAIFGLTREPFLVFTANAFALLGLRQLYFLLGGLLDRLVYLSFGLAVILGFIGVKLVLEAAHAYGAAVPEIPIWLSLGTVIGVLAVTTAASLLRTRHERSAPAAEEADRVPVARR